MNAKPELDVFFYGTFMSANVLAEEFGVASSASTPARLDGFSLTIAPRVNIESDDDGVVFGSITSLDPADLRGLYEYLNSMFGIVYVPVVVEAVDNTGRVWPVEVYVTHQMDAAPADPVYVRQLAQCARDLGHPDHYVAHIETFAQ